MYWFFTSGVGELVSEYGFSFCIVAGFFSLVFSIESRFFLVLCRLRKRSVAIASRASKIEAPPTAIPAIAPVLSLLPELFTVATTDDDDDNGDGDDDVL